MPSTFALQLGKVWFQGMKPSVNRNIFVIKKTLIFLTQRISDHVDEPSETMIEIFEC